MYIPASKLHITVYFIIALRYRADRTCHLHSHNPRRFIGRSRPSNEERNETGECEQKHAENSKRKHEQNKKPSKKKQTQKIQAKGSVLTATDDCGCVGGVRQLDPRDHGARRESLQVRWPVQPRAWTQVPPRKSTYVEASHKRTLT